MSKAGRSFRAANGSPIRNLGQLTVGFRSGEDTRCAMPFQIAEVEKPLISVSALAAAGHAVRLDPDGGHIQHLASGRTLPLTWKNGVFVLQMRVPTAGASGFPRQGC